jgi:hypothetical protein
MLSIEEIERILRPKKYSRGLELLPGESELPICLQESFWAEYAENLGQARLLGFEIVKLMDEAANLQKEDKPLPDDFEQRKLEAIEKWRAACQTCQDKHLVIWKAANGK